MLKASLGKLALGVVALSSVAVAHAEGSFASKIKPSAIGVEGLALGGHGNSLKASDFFHAGQIQNAGLSYEPNAFARLGNVKIKYSPILGWLGGKELDEKAAKIDQEINANQLVKANAPGLFLEPIAATFGYNFNYAWKGLVRLGLGGVIPSNNEKMKAYGMLSVDTSVAYKLARNVSMKVGGKYIHTLHNDVRNVSGLNVGMQYDL